LRDGPNEYTVMSFRLTKAPTYYMDLMNKDFMEYLDKFVMVFINGVLVYSKDEKDMKNIIIWCCRSFETIGCMPS
jgi:hypothetical protein